MKNYSQQNEALLKYQSNPQIALIADWSNKMHVVYCQFPESAYLHMYNSLPFYYPRAERQNMEYHLQ